MKRLLLFSVFCILACTCSVSFGANDFSGDANCVAVWNVDNGALTTDSKGTNTLTNSGMATDTSDYKQGDASCEANALGDILYCLDTNLDAGFPLKSGDTNKKISICGWFRVSAFPASTNRQITGKYSTSANGRSISIGAKKGANWNLSMALGYNSGNSVEEIPHASTIASGIWYHYGITYQDSDKSYRIRIWDDNAGSILGADKTGTATNNIYVGSMLWHIGRTGVVSNCLGGEKDEIVVFNDILTTGEIDQVRAGTYGAAAGGGGQVIIISKWFDWTRDLCEL